MASQTDIDEAFAAIIRASGLQTEEVCLDLTNAVSSTHVLESTASDETLACADPGTAAPGQELQSLVHAVRLDFMFKTGAASIALASNYDLYRLMLSWADQLGSCGAVWPAATLGPIDFLLYTAPADFATQIMQSWQGCKATSNDDPNQGGGGTGMDAPTYLQVVIDRFTNHAKKRKDHPLTAHQAKRAARDCVKAERAAQAAGQLACISKDLFANRPLQKTLGKLTSGR